MSSGSIQESAPCQSKTGRVIRKTGKPSVNPSVKERAIAAKAVPPIPNAAPAIENPIPLPEVESFSRSPTLTTNPVTVTPTISGPCASDAIPLMTPSIMLTAPAVRGTLLATINSPHSLNGSNKKPTRQELLRAIQGDQLALQQHAILLEAYKPTMDAIKLYLDIHGSQSPNFYMTKNKQVAAACQMNGLNDPNATRKQRIAAMTCYEMLMEAIMTGIESGLDKERVKQMMNDAINRAAEFFNLGNKKAVAQRKKSAKKPKGKK